MLGSTIDLFDSGLGNLLTFVNGFTPFNSIDDLIRYEGLEELKEQVKHYVLH